MRAALLSAIITISCLTGLAVPGSADMPEDGACLKWDIKAGRSVNKQQSGRLYLEASRWVKEKFRPTGELRPPCITVHVGEECPAANVGRNCLSPVTGDLYVPKWHADSPELVAQAAALTGLLHLVDQQEVTRMSALLLQEDRKDFLDVLSSANTRGK